MSKGSFSIYQVRDTDEARVLLFESLERLRSNGNAVDRGNYDLVYGGPLEGEHLSTAQTLEAIFQRFNLDHPMDFTGHSLSVSDVVVLRHKGEITAHYTDSIGFAQVPEFLDGPYRYYATQRPVDVGTFPKTEGGPVQIENYGSRVPVEGGAFKAWGSLTYSAPLTQEQAQDYELRGAINNPDLLRYPPQQLDAQLQIVGGWESARRIPEAKRVTVLNPRNELYEPKNPSMRFPVSARFRKIESELKRPTIARQLAEGAEQAAKENAARPTPDKGAKKQDKEDR